MQVRRFEFVDTTRPTGTPSAAWYRPARALPTDVYLPATTEPAPLIVLAHGSDGAPRKFTRLLRAWARAGFVAAAPRFPGSSSRTDGGAGSAGLSDYVRQPADMSFVIDRLLASDVAPRIDAARIGVAGLSLGGATIYGLVWNSCCRDPRVKAAAIFDGVRLGFPGVYGTNRVPALIVHGTLDPVIPFASARASYRDSAPPKWFLTLVGALHAEAFEDTPSRHDAVVTAVTIDFWRATLLADAGAADRITRDGTVAGLATVRSG